GEAFTRVQPEKRTQRAGLAWRKPNGNDEGAECHHAVAVEHAPAVRFVRDRGSCRNAFPVRRPGRLPVQVDDDLLQPGERLDPGEAAFLPVTRAAETPDRDLRTDDHVVVDPDVAELQSVDAAERLADVPRPDGGRETVLDVVRQPERVRLVGELLDG